MLLVRYKGRGYDLFDSIEVETSLDDMAGKFRLKTSLKKGLPFGLGAFIVIEADGVDILSGYVEKVDGNISPRSADLAMSGRDILGDLIDSSVPPSVASIAGSISLDSLCSKVIGEIGLDVTVKSEVIGLKPFDVDDITAVGFGGKSAGFLQNFARKRQIFLTTFGQKDLTLYQPGTPGPDIPKLDENSLLQRTFSYSDTGRFNKIIVGSQDNFAQTDYTDLNNAVDRRSEAVDEAIRSTRYLQINAEESMTDPELEGKAQEEVNIRRARSLTYSCTVPSHKYVKGDFIKLSDSLSGVSGVFLIRSVKYISTKSADISTLTLTYPESYSAVGERTSKRKSKIGVNPFNEDFVQVTAPTESIV